jgi:2-oxoisovalerate dehydrogenase E1 component alpha subunit
VWRARDPVERFLGILREGGVVDDAFLADVDAEGEAEAARMRDFLFGAPAGNPLEMFDHVYAARTPLLEAERAMLSQELTAAEETS